MTILWNEVTTWWNEVTKGWNEVVWNEVVMERSGRNSTVRPRPTVQGVTISMRGQLYHGHYLIISPLHGHGEVANENPLIFPHTLSIVGALVLLKRRAGKKSELRF